MRLSALALLALIALPATGCTRFPDLDEAIDDDVRTAPYLDLLPTEDLRERAAEPTLTEQDETDVEDRAETLRDRAKRLRGSVIDSETRTRMSRGIQAPDPG
ncbi:hypothetical protein BXY70_1137 [Roseovarius halotolerans]|uniref:Uncharacterized protein n=1 Tax=Roseovarius halotolerans TaxID=505353 RepID=A0A1X6Y8D3_9RHOB|nr:hypothetical protein [Roseovarius halotolerans]RKT35109.1 hypothetical protein BXY70_1137 [Roseovarius halotolerans]SLN13691.1 hypothetical protein ROH8110_00259 [Roseovarius halotolerans]